MCSSPSSTRAEHAGALLAGWSLSQVAAAGSAWPRDVAIEQLRWTGWVGLALALLLGVALWLLARHVFAPSPTLLARRTASRADDLPPVPAFPANVIVQDTENHWPSPAALDAIDLAVIDLGADLRIHALNRSAERLTGWPARDAIGQLVYSVFKARDAVGNVVSGPAEWLLREGDGMVAEALCLQARGGAQQWVEARALPVPGSTAVRLLFHCIDNRVQRLLRTQQRLRLAEGVLDHLPDAVLTVEPSGLVRSANARALRLFGYGPEEMLRMTLARLLPVPFMNTAGLKLTDYIAGAAARLPKVAGWRRDATTFPVELIVEPMPVDDGERWVVVIRDSTEALRRQSLAQRLGRLLDASSEEVYVCDAQSLYFVEVNRSARRNLGLSEEQLARSTLASIAADLDLAWLQQTLARLRNGDGGPVLYRARHRRGEGGHYPVEVRLSYSRDEEPPVFLAIARALDAQVSGETAGAARTG